MNILCKLGFHKPIYKKLVKKFGWNNDTYKFWCLGSGWCERCSGEDGLMELIKFEEMMEEKLLQASKRKK